MKINVQALLLAAVVAGGLAEGRIGYAAGPDGSNGAEVPVSVTIRPAAPGVHIDGGSFLTGEKKLTLRSAEKEIISYKQTINGFEEIGTFEVSLGRCGVEEIACSLGVALRLNWLGINADHGSVSPAIVPVSGFSAATRIEATFDSAASGRLSTAFDVKTAPLNVKAEGSGPALDLFGARRSPVDYGGGGPFSCNADGQSCIYDDQCCGGSCGRDGRCAGGRTCSPPGGFCAASTDCCGSNVCNFHGAFGGTCSW